MTDYQVKTELLIGTGFDDRECNILMFENLKQKIVRDIHAVFAENEMLAGNITSDLNFVFVGYKVKLGYIFSCNDENGQEAESFSEYCVKGISQNLEDAGYHVESIACHACEMDMEWLDRLEACIFPKRS